MRTSYDYRLEKYGDLGMNALAYWLSVSRNDKGIKGKIAKSLSNHFYRGTICDEWIEKPMEALSFCTELYKGLGVTSRSVLIARGKDEEKLSPTNITVTPRQII